MFAWCENLTTFNSDLRSLIDGTDMFFDCINLESFSSDLSSLTRGFAMLNACYKLTSFTANLPSLTNGYGMFGSCKLNTASVQNIADSIKDVTSLTNGSSISDAVYKEIMIGIGNPVPKLDEEKAFNKMVDKGWTVYVNGSEYTPSASDPTSITTLDENGEEIITPIPYYAKPVPATEETASYVDADGNYYNIAGGQFIYGDDLSTYGMFTCEEDAAANMRLTKIERAARRKFQLS